MSDDGEGLRILDDSLFVVAYALCALSGFLVGVALTALAWWIS